MNVKTYNFYDDFIIGLTPQFRTYQFEFSKVSSSFVREFNQVRQYLNIEKLSKGIEVELHVKIVNIIVKEILEKVTDYKQGPHSPTLWWQSSGYFDDYDKARFFIMKPAELVIGKKNVFQFLEEFALPAFEKYSSIEGIDSLVNSNNEYPIIPNKSHATNDMLTIYTGLITAKLLNRSDFSEIEKRNLSNLNRFDVEEKDECMERFNAIDFESYRQKINKA